MVPNPGQTLYGILLQLIPSDDDEVVDIVVDVVFFVILYFIYCQKIHTDEYTCALKM